MVSFHWGEESERTTQEYQRQLARLSVRAGADVVFGHHPHTLQSVEQYREGLIFYSLGNYFFTTLSRDVQYGLLAEVNFPTQSSPPSYTLHLMHVNNYKVHYRPRHAGSFQEALGVGIRLGRLNFFQRSANIPPEFPRTGPQFSD
jgi:poly-gamma-glutamate synthesis protein (capsule biosynthesis protein)